MCKSYFKIYNLEMIDMILVNDYLCVAGTF